MATHKKTASEASKLLSDPKTPKKVKSIAASDLAQAPRKEEVEPPTPAPKKKK